MKSPLHRCAVASLCWFYDSTIRRFNVFTIFLCALLFPSVLRAQFFPGGTDSAHSTSGQFVVTSGQAISRLARLPAVATNADFVRLEPALLAISAERLKGSLRERLGISQSAPWSGKIFLALHPAQSTDEDVTIISSRFGDAWNYRVELPDIVSRTRLTRALTAVLLLEFANRDALSRSVEIPEWMTDGLSRQLSSDDPAGDILSAPFKNVESFAMTQSGLAIMPEGMALTRLNRDQRGLDPLVKVRRILQNHPALTFEQLSWPTGEQLSGADDGVYRASAQLFVDSLLDLKNGAADMRAMLQNLPRFYNWQTAFQDAFRNDFPTPLDVEKWWALQVVDFAARDFGPQWTPDVSRKRLDQILSVPVEMRESSNSLPAHAQISLQDAIRNFTSDQQMEILQTKSRDLGLAQFQLARPLGALAAAYRLAITAYLDRHGMVTDTLKKLDVLDAQRRAIENAINTDDSRLQGLNASAP